MDLWKDKIVILNRNCIECPEWTFRRWQVKKLQKMHHTRHNQDERKEIPTAKILTLTTLRKENIQVWNYPNAILETQFQKEDTHGLVRRVCEIIRDKDSFGDCSVIPITAEHTFLYWLRCFIFWYIPNR